MDFKEAKQKKDRGMSNDDFFNWVKERTTDFKQMAVVVEHDSGMIETFYNQENSQSMIGMIDIAKHQILTDLQSSDH